MNIFLLDRDQRKCAQYHCDKHIVKMVLETSQLLSTAVWDAGGSATKGIVSEERRTQYIKEHYPLIYKPTHRNHPCTLWVRENSIRFRWLQKLGLELCREYTYRYGKVHKSQAVIESLNFPIFDSCWHTPPLEPFPLAMPDQYKSDDPIESYRNYYIHEKTDLLYYTRRKVPYWLEGLAEWKHPKI